MENKREKPNRDPRKLRNLAQYRNMTDEEFEQAMEELDSDWFTEEARRQVETFDARVEEHMKKFEEDYELSDMKFNDKENLRSLANLYVTVKDIEAMLTQLRKQDLRKSSYAVTLIEKLSKIASDYRRDISRVETDLKISRRIRKSTQEESARAELNKQKELAAKFYKKVASYIYCDKCKMLLATLWTLYPDEDNEISLTCNRKLDEKREDRCGHVTTVTTKQLMSNMGTNHPEGFKF